MPTLADETVVWRPTNEDEKAQVRQQLNRLLETSHFRNSRRYPALLRFIVEETLEGRGEFLKERLLGVSVFERPANYDTAADPIVRITIAEVRKRIAQYYHEEAHDNEMRIELVPGHYEPEFRWPQSPRETSAQLLPHADRNPPSGLHASLAIPVEATLLESPPAASSGLTEPVDATEIPHASAHRFSRTAFLAAGTAALVLLFVGGAFLWQWTHPSAINELWAPILATHRPVIFCLPNGAGKNGAATAALTAAAQRDAAQQDVTQQDATQRDPATAVLGPQHRTLTFLDHESLGENVVFSDVLATLRISNYLAGHGRESKLRLNVATTLDDLRQGPTVLIGGLDNEWTIRALAPLPYRFDGVDKEEFWIIDSKNPQNRDWSLDLRTRYAAVNRDYALIARTRNESTGQLQIIVAGIGMSGTAAAGEFLVDPQRIEELRRRIGPNFRDHDFEAVLSTDVVNGIAGSAKIVAVSSW